MGQTAIISAAASLFFFDNTIVGTEETRNWQPVNGLLNIFFSILLLALLLHFYHAMGLKPFYIPGIGIHFPPSLAASLNVGRLIN